MDILELLKQTGFGAVGAAAAVGWLFVFEHVVSGKRYRRDMAREIENGLKWEKRYFGLFSVADKQRKALDEGLHTARHLAGEPETDGTGGQEL